MRCCSRAGSTASQLVDGELRFQADAAAVEAATVALGQAGIGISALTPHTATLEELFLGMTEQARGMTRVYKWEVLKLLAQKRTYLGLGAAMLVPLLFVVVLILKPGGPNDIPLGR